MGPGRATSHVEDSRPAERAWLAAALLLIPSIVFLQQFARGLREATLDRAPASRIASERVDDPGVSELTVTAKLAAKSAYLDGEAGASEALDRLESMAEIDRIAVTRVDRTRAAIVAGVLLGPEEAARRLSALAAEAETDGDLARELHWLRLLYTQGRGAMPDEAQDSLVSRHGWFGRLALSRDMGRGSPYREALLGGLDRVARLALWLVAGALLALVVGLFALGALVSGWRKGLLIEGFEPGPGRPIHLETFVVFLGGFVIVLGLSLVPFGLGVEASGGALVFEEFLLWTLVGILAWPVIRRVEWPRFAAQVGLTRGEGITREVVCGLLGFVAGLPLLVIAAIAAGWLESAIADEAGAEAGPYPLFNPSEVGSWVLVLLGTVSAVVWAPLVEEFAFRGALYRWVRGRASVWVALPATAAIFGLIHPYTPAGWIPVAAAGLTFGALREWRGSLIAPMTAHFLHNGLISFVTIGYLLALGD